MRHLFTTAWVEILLMLLALLFYFGDSKASTSHFVFIFTLHILRCVPPDTPAAPATCLTQRSAGCLQTARPAVGPQPRASA